MNKKKIKSYDIKNTQKRKKIKRKNRLLEYTSAQFLTYPV